MLRVHAVSDAAPHEQQQGISWREREAIVTHTPERLDTLTVLKAQSS